MAEKAGGPGPVCSGGSLRDLLEVTVDLDLHSDGLDNPGRKLRDRVGARWIARPVSDRVDLIKNRIAQAGARASDWGGGFGIPTALAIVASRVFARIRNTLSGEQVLRVCRTVVRLRPAVAGR